MVRLRTIEITAQSKKISDQNDLLEIQNKKIREEEEMKSRFFQNISHEFRTPLTLIKNPVMELLSEEHLNEDEKNKLLMVDRNARRLLNLVNQLLDVSKFEGDKMKLEISEHDVMKHLKYITGLFLSVAKVKGIKYNCFFDNEKINSWADFDKIEKITTNLLSNAFKFTPYGGVIDFIACYKHSDDSDFPLFLEFLVVDNGLGIPENSREKIFDRFYQVEIISKMEIAGTGIGLSLSRELARLMHGDISVKSKLNFGSTFTVKIPLGKHHLKKEEFIIIKKRTENKNISKDPEFFIDHEEVVESKQQAEGKPIILIVDDNSDLRQMLFNNLKIEYRSYMANDGETGMNKAQKLIPDLIITDLMMPKMDGIEFCRKLKESEITCHIPVIMLTARNTLEDKINGFQTGADDYMSKPFEMAELKARIVNLLDQRKKLRKQFGKTITLDPSEITITPADENFLNNAIGIVEEHLKDENFDLLDLQEKMNLSRSTLFRKLNALTGQSPTEFIRIIRLKRAAQLLKQNFGNVTEAALEVGFNNISYFNRSFKKCFGMSPSEFIKKEKDS